MRYKGYIVIALVIFLTMIPAVTAADFSWFGIVYSNGVPVTTTTIPEGAECTIYAGTQADPSKWWYSIPLELQADAQYYEEYDGELPWVMEPGGRSFLQFGTITPENHYWGSFDYNHLYSIGYVGEGSPIIFEFVDWIDGNYENNKCHIPVTITCTCEEEVECDTLWAANGTPGQIRFNDKEWATFVVYTKGEGTSESSPKSYPLYAGAGETTPAGTLQVYDNENTVYFKFSLTSEGWLSGYHFQMVDESTLTALNGWKPYTTRQGSPIPGKFTYKDSYDSHDVTDTGWIADGSISISPDDDLYIAAHGVRCMSVT